MNKIKLPMINEKFSDEFSADALYAAKKYKSNYGNYIKAACASIGIPVDILVGFMVIENDRAVPDAKSYTCTPAKDKSCDCYVGFAQMGAATAFDTLKAQAVNLKPEEAAIYQKYLPGFLKPGGFVGFLASWKCQIYQALMKPEFAIWLCAMHVAQLMKRTTDKDGNYRLDHVIVKYNRGVGNFVKEVVRPGLQNVDTTTLAAKLPVAETRAYIKKFVGIGGAIEQSRKVPI